MCAKPSRLAILCDARFSFSTKAFRDSIPRRSKASFARGYVILCVARPLTDITLEIGVESHDKLYRNPFLDPLEPHELKADIATPRES